jgi:WD40 repeat protein
MMRSSNYSNLFLIVFEDYTMEVWDSTKFKKVRKFTSHSNKINDCFFSKDNKFIFSTSQDKTLKIFEILSGKQINSISLDYAI